MIKFFIGTLALVFLLACSDHTADRQSNNNGNYEVNILSTIDIAQAESLFTTSSSLVSAAPTQKLASNYIDTVTQSVKKIHANGSVEDVNTTTTKAESTQDINLEDMEIKYIENVNDQYILMAYGIENVIYKTYLVQKSDGSAVDLVQHISLDLEVTVYNKLTQVDSDNNIYMILVDTDADGIIQLYKFADGTLEKSLVSDPEEITVDIFNIDKYNNIIYNYEDSNGTLNNSKYIKNSGDLLSLPVSNHIEFFNDYDGNPVPNHIEFFNDYDGNIIYYENGATILKKINGLDYSINDYAEINGVNTYLGSIHYLKDKQIIVAENHSQFIELVNPAKVPKIVDLTTTFNVKNIVGSENFSGSSNKYLYLSATDMDDKPFLIKIDTDDYSYTYLTHGDYNITKLAVFPNDDITFNAIRLSDSTNVIGKITTTEGLRILEELAPDTNVTILEKIQ